MEEVIAYFSPTDFGSSLTSVIAVNMILLTNRKASPEQHFYYTHTTTLSE
jgi:hypothetical protein